MLLWPPVALGHGKSRTKTLRLLPNSPVKINGRDGLQRAAGVNLKRWIVSDCYKPRTLRFGPQLAEHILSSDPCGGVKWLHDFIQLTPGLVPPTITLLQRFPNHFRTTSRCSLWWNIRNSSLPSSDVFIPIWLRWDHPGPFHRSTIGPTVHGFGEWVEPGFFNSGTTCKHPRKGHGIALRHRIHMLGQPNMLGEPNMLG